MVWGFNGTMISVSLAVFVFFMGIPGCPLIKDAGDNDNDYDNKDGYDSIMIML